MPIERVEQSVNSYILILNFMHIIYTNVAAIVNVSSVQISFIHVRHKERGSSTGVQSKRSGARLPGFCSHLCPDQIVDSPCASLFIHKRAVINVSTHRVVMRVKSLYKCKTLRMGFETWETNRICSFYYYIVQAWMGGVTTSSGFCGYALTCNTLSYPFFETRHSLIHEAFLSCPRPPW